MNVTEEAAGHGPDCAADLASVASEFLQVNGLPCVNITNGLCCLGASAMPFYHDVNSFLRVVLEIQ